MQGRDLVALAVYALHQPAPQSPNGCHKSHPYREKFTLFNRLIYIRKYIYKFIKSNFTTHKYPFQITYYLLY